MKKLFILTLLTSVYSCSSFTNRYPASISDSKFVKVFTEIEDAVKEGTDSPVVCHQKLDELYLKLYDIDSKQIAMENFTDAQFESFVQSSFELRLEIKEKMKALKVSDETTKRCLTSVKNIVRALRYLEDYFVEYSYTRNKEAMPKEFVTLEGHGIFFQSNPEFNFNSHEDLKSGDVILSRGNAYSSAAIARIGDDDTQFSHLTLVYKDEKNKLHTSEAHIEIGNVVAPFEIHIDEKNARTVVFRNKDEVLAHEAGKYMYNHIKDYKAKKKKNIPYDFTMDYHSDDEIFCSEVIYHGYLNAGKKIYGVPYDVPEHKTTFSPGLINFLNGIGIKVNDKNIKTFNTFGPGEIQFDSRFDIIAEWRNPQKLKDTRFKDAILTKIFEWMERDKYEFKSSFISSVGNSFAWLMRKTGWSRAVVKALSGVELEEKFPTNMGVKQMNLFVVLDKVGETLYKKLEEEQAKSKQPLSFKELFTILEEYKAQDLKVYEKYRKDRRENLRNNHGKERRFKRIKLVKPDFHLYFSK
ncbi:YiiX/YebB-like N1pC/P60 family cysteine hydrolase [Bacteriovorax sp. Seq25_V]|uniref:YiiX/YebB-like N1pC/P60 family cysteine hydrolase n=1 Tax=Bacteriovorax sp. Seq25_V TaxID=1201288 RepID=UPI000389EA80|nr:YiiX/YebB-like N1pC/P60 family cysteine hydrolase [Bacteriovorax sp. Seq25_V]EQC47689.1 orthopoxovirus protein, PF05708 family [Bacteriovorax sp. Seq25_V]